MDEHDDDLESTVHEGAADEMDAFPDTGEDLEAQATDDEEDDAEELSRGDDETEL